MLSSQKQLKNLSYGSDQLYAPTDQEITRMKEILLMIYKDVFAVCKENNLTLFLGGGSALGAVRHGGFIPWDDDMDLMMMRDDYETFKRIFDRTLSLKYSLQVPGAPGKTPTNLFMKVVLKGTSCVELVQAEAPGDHGLWIDIFPIEHAPRNKVIRRVKGFMTDALAYTCVSGYMRKFESGKMREYTKGSRGANINRLIRKTIGVVSAFVPYEKMYDFFDRFSRGKKETGFITIPTGIRHYMGELHKKDVFFPAKEILFEGEKAYVPNRVHEYLTQLYGDYMTLPPEEKRERHLYVDLDFGAYRENSHE